MTECPSCGARLDTGDTVCPVCGHDVNGATASFEPVGVSAAEPVAVGDAGEVPCLVVRKGPQLGERFYLDRPTLTVGRDPESDLFLNDMTVSRAHAVFEIDGSAVTVKDAGSLNGVYVNGNSVDSAVLSNGDLVQIGTFQMAFYTGEGSGA